MGDAGDLSGLSYLTATSEPNLPNSQLLKYQVLSIISADTDITNTVSESDIFSVTVPANSLGTGNMIRVTLFGSYESNSAATMILRAKYGATTGWQDTTFNIAAVAGLVGAWASVLVLTGDGATNDQDINGWMNMGPRAAATTGFGDIGAGGGISALLGGTTAEDSTTTLTFKLTGQWSAANSSHHFRTLSGVVELFKV